MFRLLKWMLNNRWSLVSVHSFEIHVSAVVIREEHSWGAFSVRIIENRNPHFVRIVERSTAGVCSLYALLQTMLRSLLWVWNKAEAWSLLVLWGTSLRLLSREQINSWSTISLSSTDNYAQPVVIKVAQQPELGVCKLNGHMLHLLSWMLNNMRSTVL